MDNMNNNYQNNQGYNQQIPPTVAPNQTYSTPINQGTKPVTGWNWGAMMYGWVWGIANGTYMPLLALLPFLNMFWWIVCGIKGNEWAMNSGKWQTVEEFNAVQKSWNTAGKVCFWFFLIFFVIYFAIMLLMFGLGMFAGIMEGLASY